MLEADPKNRPVILTVPADKLKASSTTGSLSTVRTKIVRPSYPTRPRVAARFGIPNNAVSQIKTRVEKMIGRCYIL